MRHDLNGVEQICCGGEIQGKLELVVLLDVNFWNDVAEEDEFGVVVLFEVLFFVFWLCLLISLFAVRIAVLSQRSTIFVD